MPLVLVRTRANCKERLDRLYLDCNVRRTQVAVEERLIRESLRRAAGNRSQAARLLGISRRTLFSKMKELAIDFDGAD